VRTIKVRARSYLLKPVGMILQWLISISSILRRSKSGIRSRIASRILTLSEILNLLNLSVRHLNRIIRFQTLFIVFYLFTTMLILNRFGKRYLLQQIVLSSQLDVFAKSRTDAFRKLVRNQQQLNKFQQDLLNLNLTIFDYILLHWDLISIENFMEFFENYLHLKDDLSFEEVYTLGQNISNVFHSKGFFEDAEKVEVALKFLGDIKLQRPVGIQNESTYLTAVGHIALFGYLIMAIDANLFVPGPIEVLFDESRTKNKLFSELLVNKSRNSKIKINNSNDEVFPESDLELFPTIDGSYHLARNCYSKIFRAYFKKFSKPFLSINDLDSDVIKLGENVLKRYGVVNHEKIVGIHIREDQQFDRSNRNMPFSNLNSSIVWLESKGFTVIRLGHSHKKQKRQIGSFGIDASQISLTQLESEALNLYIWAKARYFLGNLSGGTFPPSLFGVPTLYLNAFPFTHFTLPGLNDAIIPKRVREVGGQDFMPLDKLFSKRFTHLQVEDPLKLSLSGYELVPASDGEILQGVTEFIENLEQVSDKWHQSQKISCNNDFSRLDEFESRIPSTYFEMNFKNIE
jgi:putative glycosyltransferase (TIGR04372 family)